MPTKQAGSIMEDSDFLDGLNEADGEDEVVEQQDPVEQPEPEALPAEVEPQEPEQPEVAQPEPQPQHVPITALLDERDKRKAEADRAAQLERQLQQMYAAQQQQPAPDVFDEGFAEYQQAMVEQTLYQQNLRWSERMATIQHGKESVEAAMQWGFNRCEADPHFNAKVKASGDPVGFVVDEFRRDQVASQVSFDELEKFRAWQAAQASLAKQPAQAAQPAAAAIPPPSLASAPSAGSVSSEAVPTEDDIFADAFK